MTIKRVAVVGVLVAVVLAAAVAALSSGTDSRRGAGVQSGGVLRMGSTNGLPNLNPFVTVSVNGLSLLRQMYPFLVQYDLKQTIAPDFAASWSKSDDGKTWTFRTTPKAAWSDGKPLTADDAAWTIGVIKKYAATAAANVAGSLSHLERVEAPDANTLVLVYDRPRPDSIVLAGLTRVPVLPKHVWSSYATGDGMGLQTVPPKVMAVGGGPFTLTEFKESQVALLERNAHYYGTKPAIDGFGLQIFSTPEVELNALKSGEVDWIQSVPPQAMSTLTANKDLTVKQGPSLNQCGVAFNSNPEKATNRELLKPEVRQAISHAIDRQNLIKVVMDGGATAAPSIIPSVTTDWVDPALKPTEHDPAAANRILDELGYKKGGNGIRTADGHPMSYRLIYSAINPLQQATVKLLATDLEQVGIKLVGAPATGVGFSAALKEKDYKAFDSVMDCWTSTLDPEFILGITRCDAIKTFTETVYCSKEYDDLYEEQGEAVDPAKRQEIVFQMQQLLARDKPWLWLFSPNTAEAWSNKWTGFELGPSGTLSLLTSQALLRVHRAEE